VKVIDNSCNYTHCGWVSTEASRAQEIYAACVCLGVQRAARGVARRYDEALKPLGLTSGQFSILSSLLREGSEPIGVLAALLGQERTTLTRNLRPLEAAGWIETKPDAKDARVRRVRLTDKGRELLRAAIPVWRAAQHDSSARLGEAGWDALRPLLRALA
jgi:DNA-binding MarR family transcriptional regulator